MRTTKKTPLLIGAAILLLCTGISTTAYAFSFFSQPHYRFVDLLHDATPRGATDVVLVAIDKKSLQAQEQGGLGRWQDWDRSYYATTLERLKQAGAQTVGIDIFFSEPSSEQKKETITAFLAETGASGEDEGAILRVAQRGDLVFKKTLEAYPDTILAADASDPQSPLLPAREVAGSGTKLGSVALQEDVDNILRRVPLWTQSSIVPTSFAFEVFLAWTGAEERDFVIEDGQVRYIGPVLRSPKGATFPTWNFPIDAFGKFQVRFQGEPFERFPVLSFVDVYHGKFAEEDVRGKVVLIGEMDAGLHDDLYTPASQGKKRPGVAVHAHAIQSLINNDSLGNASLLTHTLVALGLTGVLLCIGILWGPIAATITLILLTIGMFMGSYAAFGTLRLILSPWYLGMSLLLAYGSVLIYKIFFEQRQKKLAIRAFSHYVSKDIATMMVKDPSLLRLGGQKQELTVSFTDIAGFTQLSEQLSPEEISDFLHVYLDIMTEVILARNGTLDKYIGDAIMAIYGAPIHSQDHAILACHAALDMHQAIPDVLRKLPLHTPKDFVLQIRTGIATGDMVVGNFGSQTRFDYTVIGDTVNLASRLEGVNKVYHSEICVHEATRDAAKDQFLFRTLDVITVQGKKQPVRIYELLARHEEAERSVVQMAEESERAFILYQQRDFQEAHDRYKDIYDVHKDPIALAYMQRCTKYLQTPPPVSWNGTFIMEHK